MSNSQQHSVGFPITPGSSYTVQHGTPTSQLMQQTHSNSQTQAQQQFLMAHSNGRSRVGNQDDATPNFSAASLASMNAGNPFGSLVAAPSPSLGGILSSSGVAMGTGGLGLTGSVKTYTPATPATPLHDRDAGIPTPQLQNIVCTVGLGCRLDLRKIALHARNAEYNPKRFAAVIMRIREPRTTALIFSSGKMVCTGAKSEREARLAARKYARIIEKLEVAQSVCMPVDSTATGRHKIQFKEFKIQNMVGSCDVKFHIRLEGLVLSQNQFATYEPELFPGLIYRMTKPKIVLLVFVSGKIVLTGAKVRDEIYEAFQNIYPILKNFKK